MRKIFSDSKILLLLMIALYICIFANITNSLLRRCAYMSFDLAIFDQATWLVSQGKTPFVTVRGMHILADHFSIIIYFIAPIYYFIPKTESLLFVQTLALALGAIPVYAVARLRNLVDPICLLFAFIYLCYPAMQWTNIYEFHPDSLATPLLLSAFYFLHARRFRAYFACLILACLTKETMGLTIIALGLYAALYSPKRLGIPTIALGFLALLLSMATVRYFNHAPSPYTYLYEHWGRLAPHAIVRLLGQSVVNSGLYYLKLMVPTLFLALAAPEILLIALPTLAANLLANRVGMNDIQEQYTALITPFVIAASVVGYARLAPRLGGFGRCALLVNLAIWAVGASLLWGPFSQDLDHLYTNRTVANAQETRRLLATIHPTASVSAQMSLGAQLSHREQLYHFPNPFQKVVSGGTRQALVEIATLGKVELTADFAKSLEQAPVEYVALSPGSRCFPLSPQAMQEATLLLLTTQAYGVEEVGQGLILLRRGADHAAGLDKLATYTQKNTHNTEQLLGAWLEKSGQLDN